jgi:hypothetical protein
MLEKIAESTDGHVRRSRVDEFTAELDLSTRAIKVSWQRGVAPAVSVGSGTWQPLPRPLGDLRGRIVAHCMQRRTRALFEYRLARGDHSWSYTHGPWVTARQAAMHAGVGEVDAESLRKVMWLFYRNRWGLDLSEGCGWGPDSYAPMIAAVLADPRRLRARWELLIMTGGLRWPVADGDLHDVTGEPILDDFYATP